MSLRRDNVTLRRDIIQLCAYSVTIEQGDSEKSPDSLYSKSSVQGPSFRASKLAGFVLFIGYSKLCAEHDRDVPLVALIAVEPLSPELQKSPDASLLRSWSFYSLIFLQ